VNKPWWESLVTILWWIFTRIWTPAMAIGWPLFAIYAHSNPSTADMTALNLKRGEVAVCVGEATGGTECQRHQPCLIIPANRSYIVYPGVWSDAAVTVVEDDAGTLNVIKKNGLAIWLVTIWVACWYSTWHYLIRPFVPVRTLSKLSR
jgi:hypothetical protein